MYRIKSNKEGLAAHFKSHPHQEGIIVSEKKKFIYMKPTKTAGTTVLRHFLENQVDDVFHKKDNPERFGNWLDGVTDETLKEYFIFAVVRNPFDRFVSSSSYLNIPFDILLNQFEIKTKDQKVYTHTLPQHYYTHIGDSVFADFICRFECLQADMNLVCDIIKIARTSLPVTNRSKRGRDQKYYNNERLEGVRSIYKLDIARHGYEFETEGKNKRSHLIRRLFRILGYESREKSKTGL